MNYFTLYEKIILGFMLATVVGTYLYAYRNTGLELKNGMDILALLVFSFIALVLVFGALLTFLVKPSAIFKR